MVSHRKSAQRQASVTGSIGSEDNVDNFGIHARRR